MTEREKIISLAACCGIHYRPTPTGTTEMWCWDNAIEAFYHAVRNGALEEAAVYCDLQMDEPECPERAAYCAEAIRNLKETK